jgi:hypothetical protein
MIGWLVGWLVGWFYGAVALLHCCSDPGSAAIPCLFEHQPNAIYKGKQAVP